MLLLKLFKTWYTIWYLTKWLRNRAWNEYMYSYGTLKKRKESLQYKHTLYHYYMIRHTEKD